jgi:hypothetical protein
MDDRRDVAIEVLSVAAFAVGASALSWVVSWNALSTVLASAAIVAVAGFVAWRSRRPYVVLAAGVASGCVVAVSQGYAVQRIFAEFCIFDPCAPAETRITSLVDALPLALAAVLLGAVAVAVIARAKGLPVPSQDV